MAHLQLKHATPSGLSLQDVDLIHGHEFFPTGQLAAKLAERLNKPFVLTIHGMDGTGRTYATHARRAAIRRVTQRAATLVFVGDQMIPAYRALGIAADKTVVIPNGIDPKKQNVSANRPSAWEDRFLIVSVSNLTKSKGISDNIRALAQVRREGIENAHYVVVGDGRDRRIFQDLAESLGVGSSVTFEGKVDNTRALEFISMADIFSLPSTNEAFGIVYLEAMLLGKPSIGVAGQGPANFIEDGSTGFLVPPGAFDRLASIWRRLANDRDLRHAIGQQARSQVLDHFSWEANASKTLEAYRTLLGQ